jgi:hypothetical protein
VLVPCPRPDPEEDDDVKVVKYHHTNDENEG